MRDPILRQKIQGDKKYILYGGLHYLKGNNNPHFSITEVGKSLDKRLRDPFVYSCRIEYFSKKKYKDLLDLHLSDINGVPLYAVENGWYWLGKTQWQVRDNKILADHLRITLEQAENLHFSTKQNFINYIKNQKWRWKKEANDCINKHNLKIFGDTWER